MRCVRWLAVIAVFGVVAVSSPARAEPATSNSLQLGLGFRYGAEMNEGDLNPWGTGLGLNVGYTMSNAIYLGGNGEYFFGGSATLPGLVPNEVTSNLWQLSAEGGYDIGLGKSIVIRPKLGVGLASTKVEFCPQGLPCSEDSASDFLLAPGGTFILLTRSFSLSFDVRYALVFADAETAKALIFSAGIGF